MNVGGHTTFMQRLPPSESDFTPPVQWIIHTAIWNAFQTSSASHLGLRVEDGIACTQRLFKHFVEHLCQTCNYCCCRGRVLTPLSAIMQLDFTSGSKRCDHELTRQSASH